MFTFISLLAGGRPSSENSVRVRFNYCFYHKYKRIITRINIMNIIRQEGLPMPVSQGFINIMLADLSKNTPVKPNIRALTLLF